MDGEDAIGLGVIGKDGSGRLRAVAAQQRQKLSAKAQKKVGGRERGAGRGRALASSDYTRCAAALLSLVPCTCAVWALRPALLPAASAPCQCDPTCSLCTPRPDRAVPAEELRQQRRHQRFVLIAGLHSHPGWTVGGAPAPRLGPLPCIPAPANVSAAVSNTHDYILLTGMDTWPFVAAGVA